MANTIKLTVDAQQALTTLKKVNDRTEALQRQLSALKSALGLTAIAAFTASAIRMADAVEDINSATGIARENILGFSRAVTLAGGNAEQANNAILKLTQTIGDAAAGNAQLQVAFGKVGVSLNDLATLSEQEILQKTIDGLNGIADAGTRASVQADIFGKTLKGVSLQEVAAKYGGATAASTQYAQSVKQAADLQDKLDQALIKVQLSILKVIEPFAKFINQLKPEQIDRFVDAVINIGVALTALAASAKVLGIIAGVVASFGAAFKGLGGVITSTGKTFTIFADNFARWQAKTTGVLSKIGAAFTSFGYLIKNLVKFVLTRLFALIPVIGQVGVALYTINEVFALITGVDPLAALAKGAAQAYDKLLKIVGLRKELQEGTTPATISKDESDNEIKRLEARSKAVQQTEQLRAVTDKVAQEIATANAKITESYQSQIAARERQLMTELELIGVSEEKREQLQRLADAETGYLEQVAQIQARYNELKEAAKGGDAEAQRRFEVFSGRQTQLLQDITQLYGEQRKSVEQLNSAVAAKTAADKLNQFGLQQQIELSKTLQQLDDEYAKTGLSNLAKAYYDAATAANASAKAAIEAERARRGTALSAEEEQAYYETAQRGLDTIYERLKRNEQAATSWSTGWNNALREYSENATNAANNAKEMFNSFSRSAEDAIIKFTETGKFSFKSFANSIIQDLLRIQIRKNLAGLFGGIGGAIGGGGIGGLFGQLGTAFSLGTNIGSQQTSMLAAQTAGFFADGGNPPIGKASIVGERGPELFVPKTAGTIVPNEMMGGGATTINQYYTIQGYTDTQLTERLKRTISQESKLIYGSAREGERQVGVSATRG